MNTFHTNNWLARRGALSSSRTGTKAQFAALANCFAELHPDADATVDAHETVLLLRSLGLRSAEAPPIKPANPHDSRLTLAEFCRVCIDHERASKRKVGMFQSPEVASQSFPLTLLVDTIRLHDLINGFTNAAARTPSKPSTPRRGVPHFRGAKGVAGARR